MDTLITGHNEMLLRAVAAALMQARHRVKVAFLGHERPSAGWPAGVEAVALGEQAGTDFAGVAAGFEAVVLIDPSVTLGVGPASDNERPIPTCADALGLPGAARVISVIARHAGTRDDRGVPAAEEASTRATAAGGAVTGRLLTIRTSPVYGAGDDFVTLFLIMMRSLPVVPVLGATHAVRPLWIEDAAAAIASALFAPPDSLPDVIDLDGPELVSQDELYDRLAALVDRHPVRVPVPDFLAGYGARLGEALGHRVPLDASHLTFVRAAVALESPRSDALERVAGITPTSLNEGLGRLIRGLPELTPGDGIGGVDVKRFTTRIVGGRLDAPSLMRAFRERFRDVMPVPIGVESGAPVKTLDKGAVLTMALPGRGHVAVRVEDASDERVVLSTLRGHALAGFIQFRAQPAGDAVVFEVVPCDAAANPVDWLSLTLGGARLQDANWTRLLHNVATLSGGTAEPVESDARKLSAEEAAAADRWIRELIGQRQTTAAPVPRV